MTINSKTLDQKNNISQIPVPAIQERVISRVQLAGKEYEVILVMKNRDGETMPLPNDFDNQTLEKVDQYVRRMISAHKANGLETRLADNTVKQIDAQGIHLNDGQLINHMFKIDSIFSKLSPEEKKEFTLTASSLKKSISELTVDELWKQFEETLYADSQIQKMIIDNSKIPPETKPAESSPATSTTSEKKEINQQTHPNSLRESSNLDTESRETSKSVSEREQQLPIASYRNPQQAKTTQKKPSLTSPANSKPLFRSFSFFPKNPALLNSIPRYPNIKSPCSHLGFDQKLTICKKILKHQQDGSSLSERELRLYEMFLDYYLKKKEYLELSRKIHAQHGIHFPCLIEDTFEQYLNNKISRLEQLF